MISNLHQSPSEAAVLESKGYKLLSKLGEGGYAKVYLGEYTATDKHRSTFSANLACKIIDTTKVPRKCVEKFIPRELRTLAKMNHPYIIQIHSIFRRKGKIYIFMRHAEKGDLLEYLKAHEVIRERQARFWGRQIALALQYLHVMEIAHRDVKCENILITRHNNIKLSDFGFARSVLDTNFRKQLSETYCGSITYVPPEILKGEPYNPKIADMWSFGVIIFTLLNGSYPFESKNVKMLYQNQMDKKWRFRSKYVNILSTEVKDLIGNLLEPDIFKRFTVEEVLNSRWIAMDSKLKTLNTDEFASLSAALEEAKSLGRSTEPYEGPRLRLLSASLRRSGNNKNSITFIKEYDGAFDLQLIRSDFRNDA